MKFSNWKQRQPETEQAAELVSREFLPGLAQLPLVYKANSAGLNLPAWYEKQRDTVERELLEHGAILFRGFDTKTKEDFEKFVQIAIEQGAQYIEGATPRKQLSDRVYTSTEFPKEQEIKLHNELSYTQSPPNKLALCCLIAPPVGGETPIADVHNVYNRIPQRLRDEFATKQGWLLRRHYLKGFGPTIYKAMGLNTAEEVQDYCDKANVSLSLSDDGQAMTEQARPETHAHPVTGVPLWFNHVAFWHPSALCPKIKKSIEGSFGEGVFPFNTLFGDGSVISDADIEIIRQAYEDEEKTFRWQVGDVLLVDNWRVCHGRKPFEGSRQVLVSMG